MATMAAEPVLVDTNILVYSQQALSPFHFTATAKLLQLEAAGHPLWISRQILREYLSAMSRPSALTATVPMTELIADVEAFELQFFVAEDGPNVTRMLCNLLGTIPCAGKQVHDANIAATMLAHGIPNLVTHNVADFNRFAVHIKIVSML